MTEKNECRKKKTGEIANWDGGGEKPIPWGLRTESIYQESSTGSPPDGKKKFHPSEKWCMTERLKSVFGLVPGGNKRV